MQTEKAKSSHIDRTRGDKNQIFPTYAPAFFGYNNSVLARVTRPSTLLEITNSVSGFSSEKVS